MASVRQPTAPSTTTPFTLLYANAQHLRPDEFTAWSYKLCSPPSPSSSSSSSPPPLPQLFAFVEAGSCGVRTPHPGWESRHLPGPKRGVGGITLFFHHCAVRTVTELHPVPRLPDRPNHSLRSVSHHRVVPIHVVIQPRVRVCSCAIADARVCADM